MVESDLRVELRRHRSVKVNRRTEKDEPMIEIGQKAPDFTLTDHFGREVSLADFRGKRHVLVVFYPLDWTPT